MRTAFRFLALLGILALAAGIAPGCLGEDGGDDDAGDDDDADDDDAGDDDDAPPWPTCPRVSSGKSLAEKADYFDRVARERHLIADGLLRTVYLDPDLETVRFSYHVPNTILWSGMYLASQALRYTVTGETQAVENARIVVEALGHLTGVTGVSGLYGRSMSAPGVAYNTTGEGQPGWVESTAPGYEGWRYNNDVSKDSYAGLMFGYAAALEHFDDPDLIEKIGSLVAEVADHLMRNGLQIIDADGEVTEHGRLFHTALDDFPGFNALLASSWIKVAQTAADDPTLEDFYYGCLMRMRQGVPCPPIERFEFGSYIESMENWMGLFIPFCQQNYDNFDMTYQAIYPLLRREADPGLGSRLRWVLKRNMWHSGAPDGLQIHDIDEIGNSLFTFINAALSGDGSGDPILYLAVDDAICTLKEFPEEKFERFIPKGHQWPVCLNRMMDPCAADPIPLEKRSFDNYLWRLDPYCIEQADRPEDRRLVHSPEDYLVAYWLGRYHGLIPPDL